MKQPKPPSQNAIGRTLGLSSSNMTKLKKQGCPMDSVESVRAWRLENQNIAQRKPDPSRPAPDQGPSEALTASALVDAAALMIRAGQEVDAMVPALRAALAAVPPHARDLVGLDLSVMKRLLRGVLDAIPPRSENPCDEHGAAIYMAEPMSDADALEAGKFWYQVAAGEFLVDVEALRQSFGHSESVSPSGSSRGVADAGNSHRPIGLFRDPPKGVVL